ncbi:MAG: DcaP family trimeric outer membrane transporter [Myxococcota bacterium]
MHRTPALALMLLALSSARPVRAQGGDDVPDPAPEAEAEGDVDVDVGADIEALRARLAQQEAELAALRQALFPDPEGDAAEEADPEAPGEEGTSDEGGVLSTRQPIGRFPDDSIVRSGDFDRSIKVPSTDLSFRIGGLVRLELAFDADHLGPAAVVSNVAIPLDGSEPDGDQQIDFSARDSRINFDFRHTTDYTNFRAFIEADFFGTGTEALSGYGFRLRHAVAQLGPLVVGQWWSAFADTRSFPENSALGGPLAAPAARQPSLRLTDVFGAEDRWRLVLSIENPVLDLSDDNERARDEERVPDVLAAVAMDYPLVRLRVALLGRVLESRDDRSVAGGMNLSGRLQLPFLSKHGDNLAFQAQVGTGIGRYYVGLAGTGADGVIAADGSVNPMRTFGGYLALQHWWTERLRSTATVSYQRFDPVDASVLVPLRHAGYYAINLFWTPTEGATFGVDAIYATRRTSQGDFGAGLRIHSSARFDF